MKKVFWMLCVVLLAAVFDGSCWGQDFYVYPTKGQDKDQMEQDKYACYQWAKEQTGFDPMELPKATPGSSCARGSQGWSCGWCCAGALLWGVAVGAIAGDAGERSCYRCRQRRTDRWYAKKGSECSPRAG